MTALTTLSPASRLRPVTTLVPAAGLAVVFYIIIPWVGGDYLLEALLTPFLALSLAGVGLNLLTGYAGQLSLGSAAFMATGAYAAYNLQLRLHGLPLEFDIILAGIVAAALGVVFGLPSLRLRGFYLAVSTLAAQFFVQWALTKFSWFSNYSASGVISTPPLRLFGHPVTTSSGRYLVTLLVATIVTFFVARLISSPSGLSFVAIRDHETAAKVIGVPILKTKLLAFSVSSFVIGVAGVLWAFAYLRTVEPGGFDLDRSFQILFMIIIGGLGTIRGPYLGAAFIVVFPLVLSRLGSALFGGLFDSGHLEMTQRIVLGGLIILFLIIEPDGLSALLDRMIGNRLFGAKRIFAATRKA
ncbi:branched-chain amino acid ABC transporter permease [Methylocystis bryophila]|uniref:Branched-chain amino acid ABC transporter permease n=1 Tax=Methylocystis bryophila TaxID=655015 RepID=A0A1W6MS58_9HYPH|nr:branched-chain amino acid ABC transporter permease [Methylocystis bryophila]ARN80438.1 branched-chain amino acid ABC transporter permease [Methylocystis bryophila]BDV40449.1 branched-chain amino acid ABC transporter permease [Methylocystis bryophila]